MTICDIFITFFDDIPHYDLQLYIIIFKHIMTLHIMALQCSSDTDRLWHYGLPLPVRNNPVNQPR